MIKEVDHTSQKILFLEAQSAAARLDYMDRNKTLIMETDNQLKVMKARLESMEQEVSEAKREMIEAKSDAKDTRMRFGTMLAALNKAKEKSDQQFRQEQSKEGCKVNKNLVR